MRGEQSTQKLMKFKQIKRHQHKRSLDDIFTKIYVFDTPNTDKSMFNMF